MTDTTQQIQDALAANPSMAPVINTLLAQIKSMQDDAAAAKVAQDQERATREAAAQAQPDPAPDANALIGDLAATIKSMKEDTEKGITAKGFRATIAEGGDPLELARILAGASSLDAFRTPQMYFVRYHERCHPLSLTHFTDHSLTRHADPSSAEAKAMKDMGAPLDALLGLTLVDGHQRRRAQGRYVAFITNKDWFCGTEEDRVNSASRWTRMFVLVDLRLDQAVGAHEVDYVLRYIVEIFYIVSTWKGSFDVGVWHEERFRSVVARVNSDPHGQPGVGPRPPEGPAGRRDAAELGERPPGRERASQLVQRPLKQGARRASLAVPRHRRPGWPRLGLSRRKRQARRLGLRKEARPRPVLGLPPHSPRRHRQRLRIMPPPRRPQENG